MIFYPIEFFSISLIDWLKVGMMSPPIFFGGKILRIYCWGKNQPAKFDKTDYQTFLIILYFILFLFIYFMAAQKDCPDPIVGLEARLNNARLAQWEITDTTF